MKGPFSAHRIDWGHFFVLTFVLVVTLSYLIDARETSLDISNLIFVQPLALVIVLLYFLILPQVLRKPDPEAAENQGSSSPQEAVAGDAAEAGNSDAREQKERLWDLARIAILAAGFGLFVLGIERIGFDICSWFLITLGLYVCGERNPIALIVYPVVATAFLLWSFGLLIPYPITTLIW